MASVLLTTLGQALGGPVGGALGAVAGSGADQILRGSARAFPDLRVQTSSYGDVFPRVYGRTRVSGVVVWSSGMKRGGGGKGGRGGTDGFVTSLAVAISSRPILDVRRIWADGREIRNSAGEFSTPVTMRIHQGLEGQQADPLIVAFEGAGWAPGYQGLALVVFEDFPVSAYGNRIPAFSFEVVADEEPLAGEWVRDLLSPLPFRPSQADGWPLAGGFVASGQNLRSNAEDLAEFLGIDLVREVGFWALPVVPPVWAVPHGDLIQDSGDGLEPDGSARVTDYESRPSRCEIMYLDPERDFQTGIQLADSGRHGRELALGLPVAATAVEARRLAERQLKRREYASERLALRLPWKWVVVQPGHYVRLLPRDEIWRVEERVLRLDGIELNCARAAKGEEFPGFPSDHGRPLLVPALPVPKTELLVLETMVPLWPSRVDELVVVAAGSAGWRGAHLQWRVAGAVDDVSLGVVSDNPPAGQLLAAMGEGFAGVWDWRSELLLKALDDNNPLQSRPRGAVLQGANLVLIGSELIQFQEAEARPQGVMAVRGLLRGAYGTEPTPHAHGERWALLSPKANVRVPLQADWASGEVTIEAIGQGDWPEPAAARLLVQGRGRFRFAPCHVSLEKQGNGDLVVRWIERTRDQFEWKDTIVGSPGFYVVELRPLEGEWPPYRSDPVGGDALTIPQQVIHEALGHEILMVEVVVEAIGPGPHRFRRTRPVQIRL